MTPHWGRRRRGEGPGSGRFRLRGGGAGGGEGGGAAGRPRTPREGRPEGRRARAGERPRAGLREGLRGGRAGWGFPPSGTQRRGPGHEGRRQSGPGAGPSRERGRARPGPWRSPQTPTPETRAGSAGGPSGRAAPALARPRRPAVLTGAHCQQVARRPPRSGIVSKASAPSPERSLHPGCAAPATGKLEFSRHLRAEALSLVGANAPHPEPAETGRSTRAALTICAIAFLPLRRQLLQGRSRRPTWWPAKGLRGCPAAWKPDAWVSVLTLARPPGTGHLLLSLCLARAY